MTRELNRFLHPRSIAFVGGAECDVAIRRSLELGFAGRIWAVHPTREQLGGVPAVRRVEDMDGPVDAAFVAVKREPTVEVVRALRAKGCGGAVIYAAGFAEAGDHALHDALMAAADGMPLVGPNCYGFVNALSRAALWPDEHGLTPRDTGVAIITQSGNIACNLTMTRRELPLALICAIGNQADVDMAQLVTALVDDPRITAIGLHIEGLRDVVAFSAAARLARERRKPVVVLKTGRSEQGARVTLSHTSSLAGADTLYDALFHRYGIARVASVSAFVETLKFLHLGGPLADSRLVSMSCSGGEAALVADLALGRGVCFPPFDPATREKVAATLNEFVSIDNPLDYHTFIWGQAEKLEATFSAVLGGGFDVGMLILDTPTHPRMNPASWFVTARAFQRAAANTGARAAVVASLAEGMPGELAAELVAAGVAPLIGLDDAITVFEAAAQIGRNWAQVESPPAMQAEPGATGETVVHGEFAAKQLLARYGLRVPEGAVCAPGEAVALARRLGFPVTLKVSSSTIAHKTEAGGVVLNLRSEDEVAAAAARLAAILSIDQPQAPEPATVPWERALRAMEPELLCERMITGAVAELIIGLTRDPQFGTALVVGAGGVLAELLKDTVTLILPATRAEIEAALKRLRVWTLVEGFRGRRGDARAVIDAVEAIAAFAAEHRGRIEELDVNPLLVCSDGAVAVDALLKMRTP